MSEIAKCAYAVAWYTKQANKDPVFLNYSYHALRDIATKYTEERLYGIIDDFDTDDALIAKDPQLVEMQLGAYNELLTKRTVTSKVSLHK